MTLPALTAISLRIGNLTFGGGDPAMAALQRELVERRRWLSQEDFTVIWSLARVTPGTNVLACFAGAGWRLAGIKKYNSAQLQYIRWVNDARGIGWAVAPTQFKTLSQGPRCLRYVKKGN